MPQLAIDNDALTRSSSMLSQLDSARHADTISDEAMRPFNNALVAEYARMKECTDNVATAEAQIVALEKALAGWRGYKDYQERRYPGLERRYRLARDYVRAAEDEQTGTP